MRDTTGKLNPIFGQFDEVLKSVMGVPTNNTPGIFWQNKKVLTFADMFCGIGGFHEIGRASCRERV